MMEGPGANSEEKHEPASYIDTALVDSLKALDPEGPIREADISPIEAFRRERVGRRRLPTSAARSTRSIFGGC